MVATCGGQEGANIAPRSAMPAPATDKRHVLHICVARDENCSIMCMTVATEVAIFCQKRVPHFYYACRRRGGSIYPKCVHMY